MRRNQSERDLEKTERDIRRLIEAIKAGVPGATVTGKKSTIWPEPSTRGAPCLEAAECIRELIEEIRLVPDNGTLRIEPYGQLAALITLANGHPRSRGTGVQVTLVATSVVCT